MDHPRPHNVRHGTPESFAENEILGMISVELTAMTREMLWELMNWRVSPIPNYIMTLSEVTAQKEDIDGKRSDGSCSLSSATKQRMHLLNDANRGGAGGGF